MDENINATEGTPSDPGGSTLKPGTDTEGVSLTPENKLKAAEPTRATQSLWPDINSITPVPAEDTPALPEMPKDGRPLDTTPAHIPAASLLDPPSVPSPPTPSLFDSPVIPDEAKTPSPVSDFDVQPAPDPRTRITSFGEDSSLLVSEPKASAVPEPKSNLGSMADFSAAASATTVQPSRVPAETAQAQTAQTKTIPMSPVSVTPAEASQAAPPQTVAAQATPPQAVAAQAAPPQTVAAQAEPPQTAVTVPVPISAPPQVTAQVSVTPADMSPVDTISANAAPTGVSQRGAIQSDGLTTPAGITQSGTGPAVTAPHAISTDTISGGVSPVPGAIEQEAAAAVEEATARKLAVASSGQLAQTPEVMTADFVSEDPIETEAEPVEKGISVITREATVLGDILTDGHIDIVGRVKGNIDAKGDVAIHGIVRGDVGGSKIGLYSCRVKGNLDAGLGVIVDDNSIIGGDVRTKNIIFDGKVKGNIDADNVVVLRSHSYCLGDVSAASLAVEPGAILNGKVRTFVEGDLEAPFDEVL
jgi:cytoskeletal protein CcmA (bactofilin family)